ncbi:MAG: M15 family metallopeptidase [Coprobacillaceae bacterium]
MKVKKWHIYIIAIVCFALCFVAINKKYDPFYRVNGINNDNRALIEQYLDEEQQQYLIDNSIAVDLFIQYIDVPGFLLQNYEYYNMLNKAKVFSDRESLIENANTMISRLEVSFGSDSLKQCETLVSNNLVPAYLNQETFDFQNIDYYQIIRTLYDTGEYQYIEDTNGYVFKLQNDGIVTSEDKKAMLKELSNSYDQKSLQLLLTTPLQEGTTMVTNPQELSVVVDQNHFIGSYEPKNIISVTKISRFDGSMYLDRDAYTSLKEMYDAVIEACGSGISLRKSYRSYERLSVQENASVLEKPGYSEYQLGTTIAFQHLDYSIEDFKETAAYQWLLDNAHTYGYILRYPEGKQEITGKEYQCNVFRYVGVDLATLLHQNNWTLEEYNQQLAQQNQQNQPDDETEQ